MTVTRFLVLWASVLCPNCNDSELRLREVSEITNDVTLDSRTGTATGQNNIVPEGTQHR
jgi:hypothetical protein